MNEYFNVLMDCQLDQRQFSTFVDDKAAFFSKQCKQE